MNSLLESVHPHCLIAILLIGASGCGLSDYQSRMDAQRARVQEFDEINRILDDPVEMAMIPNKGGATDQQAAWPFDFYLRLPRGYTFVRTPYFTNFSCYRYQGSEPGYNIFLAAAFVAAPKGPEKFGVYQTENFRRYVWLAIDDYYLKTNKADPYFMANKAKVFLPPDKVIYEQRGLRMFTPHSDATGTIPYESVAFSDRNNKLVKNHSEFRCYFHNEAGKQVAVVFQYPLGFQNELYEKSIKACLGTLDVGSEVASKREQFKKLKGR